MTGDVIGAAGAPLTDGALLVIGVYALVAALHVALPARETSGYACDYETGKPLRYRLNGLGVLLAVVLVWAALAHLGVAPASLVARLYWPALCSACALGLALSGAFLARGLLVLRPAGLEQKCVRGPTADRAGRPQPSAADLQAYSARSLAAHFYLGMEFNPRWAMFDVKMFLYLVGAVMLSLIVLSAAALQAEQDGALSRAMLAYVGCFTWFFCEYLYFEEPHLYTYDLFAERIGFKLLWGCTCFYPFFYPVGVWAIVAHAPGADLSRAQAAACVALFFSGWVLTRGANMQKYLFKRSAAHGGGGSEDKAAKARALDSVFFGLVKQETVPGSRILCSGFWGLSRHINYMGEIIQALALALPGLLVSDSLVPLLYPLYYVLLFVPRQIDDDAICRTKYGALWDEYERRVPSRIVPGLY